MIRMIRMIIQAWAPEMGSQAWAPEMFALGTAPLSSLRDLSEGPHQKPDCVFFLRKFQWLAQNCVPDCSHSHIVGVGRSRIILRIILLAF